MCFVFVRMSVHVRPSVRLSVCLSVLVRVNLIKILYLLSYLYLRNIYQLYITNKVRWRFAAHAYPCGA